MSTWLLLHYRLPSRPSALRVYVWRKLKRLGAILLNESVWILPDTPRTAEQFQWLVVEIQEMKGHANLWRSNLVLGNHEEALIGQFKDKVDREYGVLLKEIGRKTRDLSKIAREYQQVSREDYFHSKIGKRLKAKLLALRGGAK